MNKDDSLKCISYLSDVIGLLSGKWERPHTEIEVAILKQLHDVQATIQRDYEGWQKALPTKVISDHPYFRERDALDILMEQEP